MYMFIILDQNKMFRPCVFAYNAHHQEDSPDISDSVHRDGLPLVSVSVAMCEVQGATDSPQATSAVHP